MKEKATYSMTALQTCADMVKAVSWAEVRRKNQHFAKAMEIKPIAEYFRDNINWWLIDPEAKYDPFHIYFNAAYEFKAYTNKELNAMLKGCYRLVTNELNAILTMIRAGEVNCEEEVF